MLDALQSGDVNTGQQELFTSKETWEMSIDSWRTRLWRCSRERTHDLDHDRRGHGRQTTSHWGIVVTSKIKELAMLNEYSLSIRRVRAGLLLALLALSSNPTYAEPTPSPICYQSGCIGVYGSLYVNAVGDALITTPSGLDASGVLCTRPGSQYFTLRRTHPGFKEIYAMLLSATTTQKSLFVRIVENTSECEVMYAVLYPEG